MVLLNLQPLSQFCLRGYDMDLYTRSSAPVLLPSFVVQQLLTLQACARKKGSSLSNNMLIFDHERYAVELRCADFFSKLYAR